ncbi:hypothetical protein O6H91_04G095600 [Diphasiastrum complanatum]|uniref:Uncharacterized protein n=1 Tax=Diphasiastrum complanatum TaxID=34168 RepID=A0ACC2DZP1_DIPCM|nr:hypothetical protein O6H91_04G095600 [Diphasiastrum complanatum]
MEEFEMVNLNVLHIQPRMELKIKTTKLENVEVECSTYTIEDGAKDPYNQTWVMHLVSNCFLVVYLITFYDGMARLNKAGWERFGVNVVIQVNEKLSNKVALKVE